MCHYSGNKLDGMVTVSVSGRLGKYGLVAVDAESRGRGIGNSLLNCADCFFFDKSADRVEVVTQKDNSVACLFYEKNGFAVIYEQFIYHLWLQ